MSETTTTPEQQQALAAIAAKQEDRAFMDRAWHPSDPGHKQAKAELAALYATAYPGQVKLGRDAWDEPDETAGGVVAPAPAPTTPQEAAARLEQRIEARAGQGWKEKLPAAREWLRGAVGGDAAQRIMHSDAGNDPETISTLVSFAGDPDSSMISAALREYVGRGIVEPHQALAERAKLFAALGAAGVPYGPQGQVARGQLKALSAIIAAPEALKKAFS